jgi:hypothetical protein
MPWGIEFSPAMTLQALGERCRTVNGSRRGVIVRKLALAAIAAGLLLGVFALPAQAGSPHFVAASFTTSGNTVTVSAKEAGLGDEDQIVAVLSGTADCINGGGHHPKAVNKTSFSTSSVVPVQNGKANYDLTATATFSPECAPPMTVQFTSLVVTDTTNNISVTLA